MRLGTKRWVQARLWQCLMWELTVGGCCNLKTHWVQTLALAKRNFREIGRLPITIVCKSSFSAGCRRVSRRSLHTRGRTRLIQHLQELSVQTDFCFRANPIFWLGLLAPKQIAGLPTLISGILS